MSNYIINFIKFLDTRITNYIEQGGLLTKVNNRVVVKEIKRGVD
jgi:hypothetical protein